MAEPRYLIIANPASRRGDGRQAAEKACDLLSSELGSEYVELVYTEHPKHAIDLAREMGADFDAVVALGGDGTVHEVANGLMGIDAAERPAFGLIPVGSGNDYARTLGISDEVAFAIHQLLHATPQAIDVGRVNDEWFVETLSFGLDAAIALDTVERRERTGQQGVALYLASGIDQLLHHLDTFEFSAKLPDGRELSGPVHMFAVQIGVTYGGGFRICTTASVTDGLLDLCYADAPMSVPEATFKFLRAKDAKHVRFKNIHFDRVSGMQLTFDRRPPCQVDGEPHIADAYDISVEHQALTVLPARILT